MMVQFWFLTKHIVVDMTSNGIMFDNLCLFFFCTFIEATSLPVACSTLWNLRNYTYADSSGTKIWCKGDNDHIQIRFYANWTRDSELSNIRIVFRKPLIFFQFINLFLASHKKQINRLLNICSTNKINRWNRPKL